MSCVFLKRAGLEIQCLEIFFGSLDPGTAIITLQIIFVLAKYRVFIKYCVFPYNFLNFLNSACSAAALVFYLPGVCTDTDIERKQSPEYILKSSKKRNI